MKIFLDDRRPCPDGFTLCEDYMDFCRMVSQHRNEIEEISLDYDLGGPRSGMDACRYLVEYRICPRHVTIHSDHENAGKMLSYLREHMPEGTVCEMK